MTANEPKMKTQMAIQSPEHVLGMQHGASHIASKRDLKSYLKVITYPYTFTDN